MNELLIRNYLINKGDFDGALMLKLAGSIIHYGYFFAEDQHDYSIRQNTWRFTNLDGQQFWVKESEVVSIDYQVS